MLLTLIEFGKIRLEIFVIKLYFHLSHLYTLQI